MTEELLGGGGARKSREVSSEKSVCVCVREKKMQ
jgi:hypothetical protein